jgi:YD repeat-containing protein
MGDSTCGTDWGDKVKRVDPAANVTCYGWDGLHRLISVIYTGSGPNVANTESKYYT